MLLKHIFRQITYPNWGKLAILFTLSAVLSNCGSLPQQSQNTNLQLNKKDTAEALSADARIAEQQASPLREEQLIDIAQRLLNIGEIKSSSDVIKLVDKSNLNDTNYRSYIIAASDIFTQNQSILDARLLLEEPRLRTLWDQLSIDQQKHLHLSKANIYNQIGNVQASLNERIALATLLSDKQEIKANDDALWQQLSAFTQQELVKLSLSTPHQVLSGWYQLAAVSKEHQGDLESQNKAIVNWKRLNPNHPASQQLPADLNILQTLIDERPTNIALLLPLEGKLAKAGQTIRDGFFTAYYKAQEKQESVPEIKLYNTNSDNVNNLYDKAVLDGANLVIGPLSKENVEALQLRPSLLAPVLALNYTENNASFISNKPFYQFGLSLEDEAAQAAERAWLEGHRYALVISSEANWSQRAANTFIERWEEFGGTVIRNSRFNKGSNYSENIENAFNIKKSKRRATRLKRLFGQTFEFEPRRRKDVDMIFLVSRSKEGRQIKPTLNSFDNITRLIK